MTRISLLAAACLAACVAAGEPSPDAPSTASLSDPVTHEVDFRLVVTPPYHCGVLRVWVPVPTTDAIQSVEGSRWETFPENVEPSVAEEPVYGNRFAYFEFRDPRGAQIIRHRFTARVHTARWGVDMATVEPPAEWPASFGPYLKPQTLTDAAGLDEVLGEVGGRGLPGVLDWVDANLTYDHADASLSADADHAFGRRRGHCSDYHGLCATMGRRLGVPTRVTYGLALHPKNSPSHCKLEAFLPPHGWVSFDVSETQKLVAGIAADDSLPAAEKAELTAAARSRLASGFRENAWLLMTRGTDYDLVPKASRPVRVVRTAYVEADGEPLPEPDPANAAKREFSWMTSHRYTADRDFRLPFKDVSTLRD